MVAATPEAVLVQTDFEVRLRRLEDLLARLERLQGIEQQVVERLASQIQTAPTATPSPSPPDPPGLVNTATAVFEAGRQLIVPTVLGARETDQPPQRSHLGLLGWAWIVSEVVAELQGMFYMYVDPRYRLSWIGRIMPVVFLAAFLTTGWWVGWLACGLGGLLSKPVELVLCYGLFKVLGYESRRYRETAPDLPPRLRL